MNWAGDLIWEWDPVQLHIYAINPLPLTTYFYYSYFFIFIFYTFTFLFEWIRFKVVKVSKKQKLILFINTETQVCNNNSTFKTKSTEKKNTKDTLAMFGVGAAAPTSTAAPTTTAHTRLHSINATSSSNTFISVLTFFSTSQNTYQFPLHILYSTC